MIIPEFVPEITASLYLPAIYLAAFIAFLTLVAISREKKDLHVLILTDIVGVSMLLVVSAVGTDLAEALILPGLVVELAEMLAISEVLISRELRKKRELFKYSDDEELNIFPKSLTINMEILETAPTFVALFLIGYGVFLSGFTGGAVAGGGILFYVISKNAKGLPFEIWEGFSGISGIAWCMWIIGFLLFFVSPDLWILALFFSALGLLIKVSSKLSLIGFLAREEINNITNSKFDNEEKPSRKK